VTSSNCELAAQCDVGSFTSLAVLRSSTGRDVQVKGRRICFVQLPAFGGPRLRANDARGLPFFESLEHPLSSAWV